MEAREVAESIFNTFHDGTIRSAEWVEASLFLKVSILYLAERVTPEMEYFTLILKEAKICGFEPWLSELKGSECF